MRVFISHSSKDKPAVEALARALREHGIETWLDQWTIGPGDDIVAKINAGLEEANAGLIVFSSHSRESRWVEAEVSYLTYARIQEGKLLIPVVLGDDAYVPPLLRPLARRGIEEVEAIADALKSRRAVPPGVASPVVGRYERVVVSLRRNGAAGVDVRVGLGGEGAGCRGRTFLSATGHRRKEGPPLPSSKLGDLYHTVGQGEKARGAHLKALDIRERLAQAEPDRADYQWTSPSPSCESEPCLTPASSSSGRSRSFRRSTEPDGSHRGTNRRSRRWRRGSEISNERKEQRSICGMRGRRTVAARDDARSHATHLPPHPLAGWKLRPRRVLVSHVPLPSGCHPNVLQ